MDFIQFLKEEPYYNMPDLQVECPHKDHQGGKLIGSKDEWMYDYYGEHFDKYTTTEDANEKRLLIRNITKEGHRKGVIPIYCRSDKVVFMWDSATGNTYAPVTTEDIKFCQLVADAILVTDGPSHTNEQLGISEATVLKKQDSKR